MEPIKIKIPDDVEVENLSEWLCKKINKVKITDITTTQDFELSLKGKIVTVKHPDEKQLKLFANKLTKLLISSHKLNGSMK
jgi:hypothetical protein